MLRLLRSSTLAWAIPCGFTLGGIPSLPAAPPTVESAVEPSILPLPLRAEPIAERRSTISSIVNVSYPDDNRAESIREPGLAPRGPLTGLAQSPAASGTGRGLNSSPVQYSGPVMLQPQTPQPGGTTYMLVPVNPNGTAGPLPLGAPQIAVPGTRPAPVNAAASQQANGELKAASDQVRRLARHAISLADRQAYFAAQREFEQALRVSAQALDARTGGMEHGKSLQAAFTAIEEAEEFAPRAQSAAEGLSVGEIAAAHRTPVLKDADSTGLSATAALQKYYQFAQQQLISATTGVPAAAEALYGLGKVHSLLTSDATPTPQMHTARAIVFHQAALAVDPSHERAANELGVLLARHGQWNEAKRALLHSLRLKPQAATWHNLAMVHQRIGEQDLARRAEFERDRAGGTPTASSALAQGVRWIDANEFARISPPPTETSGFGRTANPPQQQTNTAARPYGPSPAAAPVSNPYGTPQVRR